MKKVIIVLLLLCIASISGAMEVPKEVLTMRNQPLGWRGWAWGTPQEEVKGWLEYAGVLFLPYFTQKGAPYLVDVFRRQDEPNVYLGIEWEPIWYVFDEGEFSAVILSTKDSIMADLDASKAINNFIWDVLKEGEDLAQSFSSFRDGIITKKTLPGEDGTLYISGAKGSYASFLFLGYFKEVLGYLSGYSNIIIGKPEWLEWLIEEVYSSD